MLFEGQAGRFFQRASGVIAASLTAMQSVRVAQNEEAADEQTRAGLRFFLSSNGATGIAPVQALPTTAAQWFIYNPLGNGNGGITAFIDLVGVSLISGSAGAGGTLIANICPPKFIPATIPTVNTAGVLIKNANAASPKGSSLIVVASQTLQNAVAGDWFPLAQMNANAGTILGQTQIMTGPELRGRICLPPGTGLALAVISPTGTTPLFGPVGSWREYAADTE